MIYKYLISFSPSTLFLLQKYMTGVSALLSSAKTRLTAEDEPLLPSTEGLGHLKFYSCQSSSPSKDNTVLMLCGMSLSRCCPVTHTFNEINTIVDVKYFDLHVNVAAEVFLQMS